MPINGLASVNILASDPVGQTTSNTFHVVNESSSDPPDLAHLKGIADDLTTMVTNTWPLMLVVGSSLNSITVRQVRDVTVTPKEDVLEFSKALGNAGARTVTGNQLPRQVCALMQFRSVVASRRFRSHNFLVPCFSEAAVNGDVFAGGSESYWSNINGWKSNLATGLADAPTRWSGTTISQYSLCNFSNKAQSFHLPSVALTSALIISPKVRWLRSRNKGTT